jgi:hypothetical protein
VGIEFVALPDLHHGAAAVRGHPPINEKARFGGLVFLETN